VRRAVFLLAALVCLAVTSPAGTAGWWVPPPRATFQIQFTGALDQSVAAAVYDIDMFDSSAGIVASLHAAGRHVVCYVDAGTWENWRPDAARYPRSVLGKSNGWPGERWVDIRRLDALGPILRARLDLCASKGFDAVEFDNVDGYTNKTGFPLTGAQQLTFNRWLANEAHARGLGAGLKNDLDQVPALVQSFDFAIDEQCFEFDECDLLRPFAKAGKAVFEIEYNLGTSRFCSKAIVLGFSAMRKHLALDAWRQACQ
jgi:hypothetical protein